MAWRALGVGSERAVSTIRPQPALAIFGGQEQPEAAQAAGDDVGAVPAEDRSLLRRQHRAGLPGARHVEHQLAGVLGAAHHPDRGGRLGQRVFGAMRQRQVAVGDPLVHRPQQFVAPARVGVESAAPGRRRRT